MNTQIQPAETMRLKRIFIESRLPEALEPLRELAGNLWWSWNPDATALFQSIAGDQWETLQYNPMAVLDEMGAEQAAQLISDKAFMQRMKEVQRAFQSYMAAKPEKGAARIAYFCMEYGLHISLKLYSGGLGVLAGDYLKEASDSNVDMTAVGLLYRHGYFQQEISMHGDQINHYPVQLFTKLPVQAVRDAQGEWVKIGVEMPGRTVFAKLWRLQVGRIALYLLDTDIDDNSREDRELTDSLYGGDNEFRLRQEILLGMGGVKALQTLGIEPEIFHCNEGHAAFLQLQRLRDLIAGRSLSFDEASEAVRASSLFTTHTPVPAGHDNFPESMMRTYFEGFVKQLGISWYEFMALGRLDPANPYETFSMSHLAIRLSQEVNGVSRLHGEVSRKMFEELYPGYHHEELHIGYVTNSVHYPTWVAPEWYALHRKLFGADFLKNQSDPKVWSRIAEAPAADILSIRQTLKERLLRYVKTKLQADLTRRGESPRFIFEALGAIRSDALVIGFARRFATYKRAHLLFTNMERLVEILHNQDRPVLLLYAGKAHPADKGGQELIRHIVHISRRPDLAGKIIFLEDYNMEMAKLLVQGVDVWLNTPTRPKEASGTSGMKAVMNGVLNFSVLDGWWAEGYRPGAGWALPLKDTYKEANLQNELDAETIYNLLEEEIVPAYFDRDAQGIPQQWMGHIRKTFAEIAPQFTMKRMLDDYYERFYNKLGERTRSMVKSKYAEATELTEWKTHMTQSWYNIQVTDIQLYDTDNFALPLGRPFTAKVTLNLNGLSAQDVGLELVFFKRINEEELHLRLREEMQLKSDQNGLVTFECAVEPGMAGVYEYGLRMYPKHRLLPHRQDLALVRWM
jgi:glycogen phosphorylase